MTVRSGRVGARKYLSVLGAILLCAAFSVGGAGPAAVAAPADSTLPCDIYASAGTPCVAAHSTTRAVFAAYNGPLYQVTRASDGAAQDIGLLSAGGYADAAAQDAFCAGTTCQITKIYDQTANHSDLTPAPGGTANNAADRGADASELAVTAGGNKVYGVWTSPGVGYRYNGVAKGVATNGAPEGAYMVASGTHVGSNCCFDYGNAESSPADNGNGHMDAVSIATTCYFQPCSGAGPWVEADMENGMFQGADGSNTANTGNSSPYVTAMLRNDGQTTYSLQGGDSQSGGLSTWWNGALPNRGGYRPMQQEGGIILGIGGDNSNWNMGTFFEGVMVAGFPGDATENAVAANVASVGYSGQTNVPNGPQGTISGPGGQCVDAAGDDTGVNGTAVQLWNCQSYAEDQYWTHQPNGSLSTIGRCLDITGNSTASGALVELWDCTGGGNQEWQPQPDGSLLNPRSGLCLDDPGGNTANGTQLEIWTCTGGANQQFTLHSGS
ncbi:arabinofuranosidase catalytic domain-containing protein [Amycolatopsis sp. NBC_01480]|uniref:arabinofuranosidase catalytic domain-containing protein n=1 Tax=Amycolatopsis sp. NBC_01480 TaxID=2903562 RepID=UPI002E294AFA|nr:arabinofuranosidase catalytic domain-containing protein [Amycolatopsis sp. NBC_01480]